MSTKTVGEAAPKVTYRHWPGIVLVYLLIPLILFMCGGDLAWWQIMQNACAIG